MSNAEAEDRKLVENAVEALFVRFGSVQVFVTSYDHETDGTLAIEGGKGNLYTRVGHVRRWLEDIEIGDGDEG